LLHFILNYLVSKKKDYLMRRRKFLMRSKFSILLFQLFLIFGTAYPQDYQLLHSDAQKIVIAYYPNIIDSSDVRLNNIVLKRLILFKGLTEEDYKPGSPVLQFRDFEIGVPDTTGLTIRVLNSHYHLINGILDVQKKVVRKNRLALFVYPSKINIVKQLLPLVTFGKAGLVRGLPVQTVKVYPIQQYSNNKIKIYDEIIFEIDFRPGRETNKNNYTDDELKNSVVNFNVAKRWIKLKNKLNKVSHNSVLATGSWYKFPIKEEGIYKITRAQLKDYGIDADKVDPRTIKIYNNGGYMLPWSNSAKVNSDLVENAIYVKGEEDSSFDENDYILFYARGTDFYEYNRTYKKVLRHKDYYSKENYYWITFGGAKGKRMQLQKNSNNPSYYLQTTTIANAFRDEDKINIIKSGVIYVGDEFNSSNNSRTYITPVENILPDSKVDYKIGFVNNSSRAQLLNIYENNKQIFSQVIPGAFGWEIAHEFTTSFVKIGIIDGSNSVLKFVFNASSISAKGYLDYFEINFRRYLKTNSDEIIFYSKDTTATIRYRLTNFSNSSIWAFNVTDFSNVKLIEPRMLSGGEFVFQSDEMKGNVQKYLALNSSKFLTPPKGERVENQNLHGIVDGSKYIIITHPLFAQAAEKLAQYRSRSAPEKLSTRVILINQIFNEFSSGNLDPTAIRNFIRYAFNNWVNRPFYVLLFGDGDYDYLNTEGLNKNFIPVFETKNSFDEVFSYPYDDFYGRISGNDAKADIALGRINVQSAEEADIVVDKIITYETKLPRGLWRNRITLVADDGKTSQGDDGNLHTNQSEILANYHIPKYFDLDKLYLSLFPTVNTGLGRRKPKVNEAIINDVNNGVLILNFIGHGNPQVWTHEVVFDRDVSIPQFKNDKYFFLMAATCDFGRYDDPSIQSGTEEMLLKKNAGIIGGVSASRPVYSQSNARLANEFFDYLLFPRDSLSRPITLGEAYFRLKRIRTGSNDEKYHLFADPALRLDLPEMPVAIDSINGKYMGINVQLKALGYATIKGEILKANNQVDRTQNGKAIISVYDSRRKIYLSDIQDTITVQGGLLFRGQSTVSNGEFKAQFILPKDISYENKHGKIVAYFFNDERDGVGYNSNFIVGGTDSSRVNDGKGPQINIYFDNTNFSNAYLVNPDFKLIIKLKDETGLNTTGTGVGHKLEAILNDDESNAIDLTKYFIGDINSGGKSGIVNYKFTDMKPGEYKIKIKAWDVFNNLNTKQSYFSVVSNSNKLIIRDVYNYPNPFYSSTVFTFQQNLTEPIDVTINIYTVAGRLIKSIVREGLIEKFVKIQWDGRDEDQNLLANGTYLYKIMIKSSNGKFNKSVLGKLTILR